MVNVSRFWHLFMKLEIICDNFILNNWATYCNINEALYLSLIDQLITIITWTWRSGLSSDSLISISNRC